MSYEIILSSAVVSTLVSVIGGIITAHISRKNAADAAKQELERLERTWDHEDIVSSEDEFSEMAALVSKFVCFANGAWDVDALSKVAEVRSRESGVLGTILDKLYASIRQCHYQDADNLLSEAIAEKRRIKQSKQDVKS